MTSECPNLCPLANGCWLVPKVLGLADVLKATWAILRRPEPVAYAVYLSTPNHRWTGQWMPDPASAYQDALTYMETLI